MNTKAKETVRLVEKLVEFIDDVYYVGSKAIGDYGRLYNQMSFQDKKYVGNLIGIDTMKDLLNGKEFKNDKVIVLDVCAIGGNIMPNKVIVLDRDTKVIRPNVFQNSNGNLFVTNSEDSSFRWATRYFNSKDSRIIKKAIDNGAKDDFSDLVDIMNFLNKREARINYDKLKANHVVEVTSYDHDLKRNWTFLNPSFDTICYAVATRDVRIMEVCINGLTFDLYLSENGEYPNFRNDYLEKGLDHPYLVEIEAE